MRWSQLVLLAIAGCGSPSPGAVVPAPADPSAFIQTLEGDWEARWRTDELLVSGSVEDGVLSLRRASPRNPDLPLPQLAPDTLIQFSVLDSDRIAMRNPNSSHDVQDPLCPEAAGVWRPCADSVSAWQLRFVSPDLVHIGEPEAPRAVLRRVVGPDQLVEVDEATEFVQLLEGTWISTSRGETYRSTGGFDDEGVLTLLERESPRIPTYFTALPGVNQVRSWSDATHSSSTLCPIAANVWGPCGQDPPRREYRIHSKDLITFGAPGGEVIWVLSRERPGRVF